MFAVTLLKQLIKCLWVIVIVSYCVTVAAQESQEYFKRGIQHSKTADFQGALEQFKAAERSGMQSDVLKYNLAVVYYRLNQLDNSRSYFKLLENNQKYTSLANYNLGLIDLRQDQLVSAEYYFRKVIASTTNKTLIALSKKALNRIGIKPLVINQDTKPQIKTDKSRRSKFEGYLSAGLSYDDNIGLLNEVDAVNKFEGTATELYLLLSYNLMGDYNSGVNINAAIDRLDYSDTLNSDFNFFSKHISIERNNKSRSWISKLKFSVEKEDYGEQDYLKKYTFEIHGKRYINKNYLRVSYKYYDINEDNIAYSYLDGTKHRLKFDFTIPDKKNKYRLGFVSERNDRNDLTFPVSSLPYVAFRSYSPTRMTLLAEYYYKVDKTLRLSAKFQYRNSRYSSDDFIETTTGTVNYQRVDNRRRIKLQARKYLTKDVRLLFLYDYMDNGTNKLSKDLENLSYTRSLYKLSLSYDF